MRSTFASLWLCLVLTLGVSVLGAEPTAPPVTPKESKPERHIPTGPLGDTIRLGRELVERTSTHELSKSYVGNALNCTSCHLQNGTDPKAASLIGVAAAYPAWSPREQQAITLEDRILNCFMRSCNGVRPPLGSKVSVSIAAYITWLSSEHPIRMNSERPAGPRAIPSLTNSVLRGDADRGAKVYAQRCASCHADDGQGDEKHPPLWGERSYNDGAGLAQVSKLAAWLKVAMPPGETDLEAQEAFDLAAYVNRHDRPKFDLKNHLPAKDQLGEYNGQQTAQ
jgi:thiosulfate dehydrogenase